MMIVMIIEYFDYKNLFYKIYVAMLTYDTIIKI